MKKASIILAFIAYSVATISCGGGNSDNGRENEFDKKSNIRNSAFDKGYKDGKAHRYYNCHSQYDGTDYETTYLLGYKDGYNKGQYE